MSTTKQRERRVSGGEAVAIKFVANICGSLNEVILLCCYLRQETEQVIAVRNNPVRQSSQGFFIVSDQNVTVKWGNTETF
jgi:hypothetical protein